MKTKSIPMVVMTLIGICILTPMVSAETAVGWTENGIGFVISGEYEKAIECFNMAIVMHPNDAEAYYWRGLAYCYLSQYERAIELNPNDADAYANRGLAYHELSQYERAIEDFGKAIALDPTNIDADHNRDLAMSKSKKQKLTLGFEAIFAITGLLAVVYLSRRKV